MTLLGSADNFGIRLMVCFTRRKILLLCTCITQNTLGCIYAFSLSKQRLLIHAVRNRQFNLCYGYDDLPLENWTFKMNLTTENTLVVLMFFYLSKEQRLIHALICA